jgi:hypothetical protein
MNGGAVSLDSNSGPLLMDSATFFECHADKDAGAICTIDDTLVGQDKVVHELSVRQPQFAIEETPMLGSFQCSECLVFSKSKNI